MAGEADGSTNGSGRPGAGGDGPPPRLIATDLDGTLLRSDGTLSRRTCRALLRVAEAGAEVVFITARPPHYAAGLLTAAGLSGTAVCSNGAVVYDLASRSVVGIRELAAPVARGVADTLTAVLPGIGFAVESGHKVWCEPSFTWRSKADAGFDVAASGREGLWAQAAPIVKLLAWSPELDADRMLAIAGTAVSGMVEVTHSGGAGLLEISAPGVTKSGTLAAMCAARGISAGEVAAFGDMPNDLTLLKWAGAAYAMGNGHPAVLAAVERRTVSNDEDGVARVLEDLFSLG